MSTSLLDREDSYWEKEGGIFGRGKEVEGNFSEADFHYNYPFATVSLSNSFARKIKSFRIYSAHGKPWRFTEGLETILGRNQRFHWTVHITLFVQKKSSVEIRS